MSKVNENDIRELLFKLGAPTNTKGYIYLISAIDKVIKDSSIALCTELYPEVAQECGAVSWKSVEKCMRYVINETLCNCPTEYLHDIFKGRTQVSNSKFITCVAEYLKIKRNRGV